VITITLPSVFGQYRQNSGFFVVLAGILEQMTRFFASFACILPLMAQSWDPVRALGAGARVKVREIGGVEHKGNVTAVTPDAIAIAVGTTTLSIERTKVGRVQVHAKSRRSRNIAIGAGIGLALGVAVDRTLGTYLRNEGVSGGGGRALTYIAPIGLFGGIGAALSPYKTIYRAP
jgi:hypothetical protein